MRGFLADSLAILLAITIAIGVGGASVWYALQATDGIGAVRIGAWTAYPDLGTPQADPYSKARHAREGGLSLGIAEGFVLRADSDLTGDRLLRNCTYLIDGTVPAARFWTLYAADDSQVVLPPRHRRLPAVHSREILRRADNSFVIAVGPSPQPGTWLPVGGGGTMNLFLTLYDTPLASGAESGDVDLPRILRIGCDG